jgi:hypothetical protein
MKLFFKGQNHQMFTTKHTESFLILPGHTKFRKGNAQVCFPSIGSRRFHVNRARSSNIFLKLEKISYWRCQTHQISLHLKRFRIKKKNFYLFLEYGFSQYRLYFDIICEWICTVFSFYCLSYRWSDENYMVTGYLASYLCCFLLKLI